MGSPAKFLFDNDFGTADRRKSSISLSEHALRLAEADQVAYRNGVAAGRAEAQGRIADALQRIAVALETLGAELSSLESRIESEAIEVAVAVAKKLAGTLLAREPLAEVAALTTSCLRQLLAAPHLIVRVNDGLQHEAQARLADNAQAVGFTGRLVVLADPAIGIGDCRIEWADGGIVRERATTEAAIDEAVTRYAAGRSGDSRESDLSRRAQP